MCNPTITRNNEKKNELSHEKKSETIALLNAVPKSPRHALELAMELNAKCGHENFGCLSYTHGFAPQITPPPRLPDEFKAWDELGENLPSLWSAGRLQQYIDEEFPMLDATRLPQEHALRAAHILGITIHAYWHVGGLRAPIGGEELVPKNLERPWYYIVTELLDREHPFMGFYEMLMAAFCFPKLDEVPKALPEHKIPWYTEKKREYGQMEYNPQGVTTKTLTQVVSLSGVGTEKYFFCSFAEMNCRGAPLVSHIINAQEAAATLKDMGFTNNSNSFVGSEPRERLATALRGMVIELQKFTESFRQIHGMRASETYVDPTVWAEAVAPVDKPFPGVKVGPSGAGMPLSITLDAFYQRSEHGNFIGKEVIRQMSIYPKNWQRFIKAVRAYTGVGAIISAGCDDELKGLFANGLRAYAGEEGFLGVHKLKMYGYMEFTKKLARGKTTGYAGVLRERIWTKIAGFMHDAQMERWRVPLDGKSGVCQIAKILPSSEEEIKHSESDKNPSLHVRLNVEGTGIYSCPGDRVGILYESDEALVNQTIMALSNYDGKTMQELSELNVKLTDDWREAIRARPEFHESRGLKFDEKDVLPHQIPISKFLHWAKLRPADKEIVRKAYGASLNPMLLRFLETHREPMLQAPDLMHLLCRSHPNMATLLLHSDDSEKIKLIEENCEKMYQYADLDNDGFVSRKSMIRIARAVGHDDAAIFDMNTLFDKYDVENIGKLEFAAFKAMVMDSAKEGVAGGSLDKLFRPPSLSDILPPIEFRVYSVASSHATVPGEVHLCVEKVQYEQKNPTDLISPAFCDLAPTEKRFGSGSNFLKERVLEKDDERKKIIIQHYRQPAFQLPPADANVPVLMFAAGSGIAPFRSFWQELAHRHSEAVKSGSKLYSKPLLVLQSKTRASVPFADELASLVGAGVLDLQVWLSREDYTADFSNGKAEWVPAERGYVHKSIMRGDSIRDTLDKVIALDGNGYVYLCSGSGFADVIMKGIADLIGEDGIETVMSKERIKLEVFTSLKGPDPSLKDFNFSDLMHTNDFQSNDTPLYMIIEGMVYDIRAFATRHPGGTEILYLYLGMDATEPWVAIGHDVAPEVRSLLDMYLVGRYASTTENDILASSTETIKTSTSKTYTPLKYFKDIWYPMSLLYMESQNILSLGLIQFWDGGAKLTSAEPDPNDGHMCTWEGESTFKPKRSILQGQMFTAMHRKVWNELLPSIFAQEFTAALTVLDPEGLPTELAQLRMSDDHATTAALVDMLEGMIQENTYAKTNDGTVPAKTQALFDAIRIIDENFYEALKKPLCTMMKSFEIFGSTELDKSGNVFGIEDLMKNSESAVKDIFDTLSKYCADCASFAKKHFDKSEVEKAATRLALTEDCGGLCKLFPLSEMKIC